ncbi:MAG: hypothetical protein COV99_08040 [Bacteroidetes bacterium CG12_big_fil_rev_8_21_14_0_65_60_17]|nr:MAG: hypothetical protein COV99_08040 [Bacteroidetes bacterium CG12_big_fil_rev_8_21_14_0_65_60_17]
MNRIPTFPAKIILLMMITAPISTTGYAGITAAQTTQECETDDRTVRVNYSLYAEDYKNKSFDTALPYLRWILRCAPGFPANSDRNFERAVKVYEGIALSAEDEETKRVYLDSALFIYDTALPRMEEAGIEASEFEWVFNKGRFLQTHGALFENSQALIAESYRRAYELDHSRLQPYYVNYIIDDMVRRDQKADAIEFLDRAESDFPDSEEIQNLVNQWRTQLFTSPADRIGFLEDQLADNPDDLEMKEELLDLYLQESMRSEAYDLADQVMQSAPSARLYRTVAKMRLEDGNSEEAIRLYEESLELEGGMDSAREVYYNIGIAHQQEGRLARARTSFRRSLQTDASYAQALMAIGDLYVSAVQGCGSFEREDRAVYWLAADYFDRAAARADDDRIAQQARSRARNLTQFYPSAEDKFFKSWNPGDRITIDYGCYTWINESTTVR